MGKMNETLSTYICDKSRLKKRIDKQRKNEETQMNKFKKPLLILGAFILVVGLIATPFLLKKDYKMNVEYTKYLSENKALNKTAREYETQLKESFSKYMAGTITESEYFSEVEAIRKSKSELKAERTALKAKYKVTDDLDLSKVKFSDNKKNDEALKKVYLSNKDLESKDEALDQEEDALEKMYASGSITKEDFAAKKAALEAREDALEAEEDALEAEEERLDKLEEEKDKEEDRLEEEEDKIKEEADKEQDRLDEEQDKLNDLKDQEEQNAEEQNKDTNEL